MENTCTEGISGSGRINDMLLMDSPAIYFLILIICYAAFIPQCNKQYFYVRVVPDKGNTFLQTFLFRYKGNFLFRYLHDITLLHSIQDTLSGFFRRLPQGKPQIGIKGDQS